MTSPGATPAARSGPDRPGRTGPPRPPRRRRPGNLVLVLAVAVLLVGVGTLGAALLLGRSGAAGTAAGGAPSGQVPVPSPASPSADGAATITVSAVGDTIMAAAPNVPANNARGFFDEVREALRADLQMANLEEAITGDTGVSKCGGGSANCHAFRAPTACAQVLKDAGFGLLNLANNHTNDFGDTGAANTRDTLAGLGLAFTGPPGLIPVVTVKGVTVAVLGFAPYPWANSLTDIPAAAALVKQARAKADLVIVQAHAGGEGTDRTHVRPGTETFLGENRGDPIAFGHAVVDAGAALVIMHGPHVMRGMEFYQGHLIAYSMGNFAGYHALSTGGILSISGVLHVTLGRDGRYVGGTLVATSMVAPGVPRMDPDHRAIAQVRTLTKADFPQTGAVLAADGAITAPAG